jgi:hypothetical protein
LFCNLSSFFKAVFGQERQGVSVGEDLDKDGDVDVEVEVEAREASGAQTGEA